MLTSVDLHLCILGQGYGVNRILQIVFQMSCYCVLQHWCELALRNHLKVVRLADSWTDWCRVPEEYLQHCVHFNFVERGRLDLRHNFVKMQ